MSRRQSTPTDTTRVLATAVATIAVAAVLALTGCAADGGTGGDSSASGSTNVDGSGGGSGSGTDASSAFHDLNGRWELFIATDEAGAFDLSSLALLGGSADVSISLTLTDGQVSGNGTCNSYGGAFSGAPDALTVDGLSQTEKSCADSSLMELDARYLAALGSVTSAKLGSSAGLILLGDGISLSFVPVLE